MNANKTKTDTLTAPYAVNVWRPIVAGFAGALAILVLMVVIALRTQSAATDLGFDLNAIRMPTANLSASLAAEVYAVQLTFADFIIGGERVEAENLGDRWEVIDDLLVQLNDVSAVWTNPENVRRLRLVEDALARLKEAQEDLLARGLDSSLDPADAKSVAQSFDALSGQILEQLVGKVGETNPEMQGMRGNQQHLLKKDIEDVLAQSKLTSQCLTGLLAVGFILIGVVGWRTAKSAQGSVSGAWARIRKSEERIKTILNTAVDGILSIDEMGTVASINPAGERLFGYRADEVIGQNVKMLMPEPYHSEHDGYLGNYRRSGVAKVIGRVVEVTGRRKDGSVFSIELAVREVMYGGQRLFTGIVRDVTQRKEVEERLRLSEHELRDAYETVSRTVNSYLRTITEIATGDLTRRVETDENDPTDLARFGGHLNTMTGNLESIAKQISGFSEALIATLSEVTASVSQQVVGASEQASAVSETSATLRQIEATTDQTLEMAQRMGESATRARKESELGLQAVAETIRGMESIRDRVAGIATTILTLSEQSQQIGTISRVVTKLAQQSKLVSLNASIEAAKAGDAGRGFAVVATEVKDLAEQSEQSIDQIQRILEDIRHATDRAVMATEEGSKGVDAGVVLVMRTGEIMHQLSEVVRETTLSTQQIVAAVRQEASGITQVGDSMREVDAALAQNVASNRQLEATFANMLQMAGELKESIQIYRFEK